MSRAPEMALSVMDKTTGARSGKIGHAWQNDDGSIRLVLSPGTSISYNPDLVVMLFPNTPPPVARKTPAAEAPRSKHEGWSDADKAPQGAKRSTVAKQRLSTHMPERSTSSPTDPIEDRVIHSPPYCAIPSGEVGRALVAPPIGKPVARKTRDKAKVVTKKP